MEKVGAERAKAVNDEVDKLLKISSIREVQYPNWLAIPVVVKKKNGKWRLCIDFTDLNKACPKDSFSLPHIDRLVEATAGHELLSFMDAFSGYNQILMNPDDQAKMSFIPERRNLKHIYASPPHTLRTRSKRSTDSRRKWRANTNILHK